MFIPGIENYHIILASESPRRHYLLKEIGLEFEIKKKRFVDESYPKHLIREQIPLYIAEKKAQVFDEDLSENQIVITADTIVWLNDKVLQKPVDFDDAVKILKEISGQCHQVYTGVCIKSKTQTRSFAACTDVYFRKLTFAEIDFYINHYQPFDKAGAYGIQEWIGYVGVEKINGSFFNVMGLPIQKLYTELDQFININE
ncbi:MAG: Maf family nucleotide pyrophosphatase [Bacteroidales bacterium]|jgi:septum formation protein|nr:Maf family nucleotide pyrophosphatase [Bacteroidales bacterium]